MNYARSLIAGFAGAAALNIIHEVLKRIDPQAPRIDLVGEQAVRKSAAALDMPKPEGQTLYGITLAGDLLSNATYYSAIGVGNKKFMLLRALGTGISAGLAALKAPEALGLNEKYTAGTDKRKVMTVAYYLFGAMVTAGVMQWLEKNRNMIRGNQYNTSSEIPNNSQNIHETNHRNPTG